jgi:hypothetical protein
VRYSSSIFVILDAEEAGWDMVDEIELRRKRKSRKIGKV